MQLIDIHYTIFLEIFPQFIIQGGQLTPFLFLLYLMDCWELFQSHFMKKYVLQ